MICIKLKSIFLSLIIISSYLPVKAISLEELSNSHIVMQNAYGKDNNENKSENKLLDKVAKALVIAVGVLVIVKASYDFSVFLFDCFCPLPLTPCDLNDIKAFIKLKEGTCEL